MNNKWNWPRGDTLIKLEIKDKHYFINVSEIEHVIEFGEDQSLICFKSTSSLIIDVSAKELINILFEYLNA